MFHLLAFEELVTAGSTDEQLDAIPDPVFTQGSGLEFQAFQGLEVIAAYASGASITRAQLVTPTLRPFGNHQIDPINPALLPAPDPNVQDLRSSRVRINPGELIRMESSNNLGAATEQHYGLLFVTDPGTDLAPNLNGVSVLRFTATPVGVAQGWSALASVTLPANLPPGDYNVWGLTVQGAALVAARLRFPSQLWRPGVVAKTTLGDRSHWMQYGKLGLFGTFNNLSLFQLEVLANAAGAVSVEGRLWITPR
jgi:hypothetical protein